MKYSFVLPAYKAHFFKEAIDSILVQTYTDFELIIVNDASPEDLDAIVHSYDDSRIRYYVNERNIGGKDLVAQWNHCLEYAQGDYVILASDDDVYHPEYLEKMDVLVEKYPEVNVFRPRVQRIDEKGRIIHVEGVLNEYSSQLEFAYHFAVVGSGIPFYIFKRKKLETIGGFVNYPLAWHSDDATVLKMAKEGIVFLSEILFSFRHSGESISSRSNDGLTLKLKVKATELYYNDLLEILANSEKTDIDCFYFEKIKSTICRTKAKNLRSWFYDSTKGAVIRCLPIFMRLDVFTLKILLSMYIRRFLLI